KASPVMTALTRRAVTAGLLGASVGTALGACEERSATASAVYALLDVSGSYFRELDKAVRALRVMMGFMHAYDSFAVAEIGACSFTDEAVILRFTAPDRPSERQRLVAANAQRLAGYAAKAKATSFTDIRGALTQAAQQMAARPAATRAIVLFSDLDEDLPAGCRVALLKDR
ncbi:MAG TPA: vWA domain-containing protein, partial [Reyranella sp.]|nr:vWA domain-containing protein [Reyranella sp.]